MDPMFVRWVELAREFFDASAPIALVWFTCAKVIWPNILKINARRFGEQYSVLTTHWGGGRFIGKWSDWLVGFLLMTGFSMIPHGFFAVYLVYVLVAFSVFLGA